MSWKPGQSGNPKGRAKGSRNLGQNLVKLADEAATLVLTQDMEIVKKPAKTKVAILARDRARDRISRLCKGRVPTRIAIAGDEGGDPVPISYIEVGGGIDVEPKKPTPKKKPRLKRKHSLSRIAKKKGKLRPVPKILRGKSGFGG